MNNLASLYQAQGRYDDAETPYSRALNIREVKLGPEHPDVANSLSNLASLDQARGRYTDAEVLLKRAQAIKAKVFNPITPISPPDSIIWLRCIRTRAATMRLNASKSLAIREKALGPDHLDVARSLSNLAALFQAQGRYLEAEPPLKRALAIREKALGPEHPDLTTSLNNLASLYRAQDRYAEAEPVFQRALVIREKAFGPDHPATATSLNNLAEPDWAQGRFAEAEPLFKRALAIREKALGQDHPDVAASLNNLASVYQDRGRYEEAEVAFKRALAIREEALGPKHPELAIVLNNLAALYREQQRYSEALSASARVVEILSKRLSLNAERRTRDTDAEQRANRFYFTNYILIAGDAAGTEVDRRPNREQQRACRSDRGRLEHGPGSCRMAARFASGATALAAAIRERQDWGSRLQRLEADLIGAAESPPGGALPAEEAALRANVEDTVRRLDALDGRIAAEFPGYKELSDPKPLSAEAAEQLLAPDEALLLYLTTARRTWLWVVRRGETTLHRIFLDAKALADQVTLLRASLDPELNPEFRPFPAEAAYELFQMVLEPAVPQLRGVRHLLIVPDGALESLPLSVLVTKAPERKPNNLADHRDFAWLARDYALTVLPSVSSLQALRNLPRSAAASAPFPGDRQSGFAGYRRVGTGQNVSFPRSDSRR